MDAETRKRRENDTTKSDAALKAIEEKLSTFDGIALGDAFALAGLIKKYGDARATEAVTPITDALVEGMTQMMDKKLSQPPKNPWEG